MASTNDKVTDAMALSAIERDNAIEVNKLHAMAEEIKKFPMGGWFRLRGFATRVVDLIVLYWALKKDHHQVHRIFIESMSPLGSAAEDYKETRRFAGVLGERLKEEREAHNATKGEMGAKIEDLEKQLDIAVKQMNTDKETIRARDETIMSLNEGISRSNMTVRAMEGERDAARREREKAVGDLAEYRKSALEEVSNAYKSANEYRNRMIELETGNAYIQSLVEEQRALNIKLAERCHGQHEIISGQAEKKA